MCANNSHSYEWGYVYGEPQAIAPLPQVRAVLDYALSVTAGENIFLGAPLYAYDWPNIRLRSCPFVTIAIIQEPPLYALPSEISIQSLGLPQSDRIQVSTSGMFFRNACR